MVDTTAGVRMCEGQSERARVREWESERVWPRPHEAETGETVTVSIYPVSQYLRKDGVKRNRVDL